MLASPQRAAFPRAEEIPEAVAAGRKRSRGSGAPPFATRLRCPPVASGLPSQSDPELPQSPPHSTSSRPQSPAGEGLAPARPCKEPGRARTSTPAREAEDPSQWSADNLGRQMARRMGRQIEASAPCQDDTQKYIPVIAGCQWRVSARCRVCFWTLCEFGRLSWFPLP